MAKEIDVRFSCPACEGRASVAVPPETLSGAVMTHSLPECGAFQSHDYLTRCMPRIRAALDATRGSKKAS